MSNNTDPQDSIVFNPEATNTKSFDKDSVEVAKDVVVNENIDSFDDADEIVFNQDSIININSDNDYNIDISEYSGDLGHDNEDVYMPDFNGIDVLNQARSDDQAWYEQAGNFLGQAVVGEIVGGTIEGLGYMLDIGSIIDVMQGDEADWGNFMTDFGQNIRTGTEEALRIHQDPSAQGWSKMLDSGWWAQNLVSTASTFSMLVPTMGAMKALSFVGKGIGASKGMKAVRKAAGMAEQMGTKSRWMTNGLSQAVLSRNIENWMEAHGTYESYKNEKLSQIDPETGDKYTEEKANQLAGNAASDNWKKGWVMLLQDIPQYLAIGKVFDPISKKMVSSLGKASKKGVMANLKPWQQKGVAIGSTFVSEGAEESYQYLIAEHAKFKADLDSGYITPEQYDEKMSDAYGSEEMMTSAFFGGLGGNLFQMAGSGLNEVFKSKDRKAYEEGLGKMYTKSINDKAKQVALMFQHLNQADQSGSPVARAAVINESMLNLTAEALENGKFDQFYETIGLVSEMSEEDLKDFQETTGQEFSTELAKEYAPKIQKKAIEMRDKYFKHRGNNHSALTSSRLSRLELENDGLSTIVNDKRKTAQTIKAQMGESFDNKASDSLRNKLELRERGQVLRKRKTELNKRLKNEKSDIKKAFIQEAIDTNQNLLDTQAREAKEQTARNKAMNDVTKEIESNRAADNKAAEKIYNKLYKNDILTALDIEAQAREQIIINNEDMAFAKTEEGANLAKGEDLRKHLASYDQIEDKAEAVKQLKEAKDLVAAAEFLSESEKTDLQERIDKTIKSKETQIREDEARRLQAEDEEFRKKKAQETNNNDSVVDNENTSDPLEDGVIEDENGDESPSTTKDQLDQEESNTKNKIGGGQYIGLLDKIPGDSILAFTEWSKIPSSKEGKEFTYGVSTRRQSLTDAQNDAIQDFENAKKSGMDIPESVYENLPIQATLSENKDIFTFLPTKPTNNNSDKINEWTDGYYNERVVIIETLKKGLPVKTKVKFSTGGQTNTEFDYENNLVPENSILDIMQLAGNLDNAQLVVSNIDGELFDMNKEPIDIAGFNPRFTVGPKNNGNKMPYRGGVFLIIKKANGKPFALRLNLLKNTDQQAELLADLLIRVGVPRNQYDEKTNKVLKNKKGVNIVEKELKFDTLLSQIKDKDLLAIIKDVMAPEIAMADPKNQDPSVMDLISTFLYISEKGTKGKTSELYFDNETNDLVFGGRGDKIDLKTRGDFETRSKLIDFLRNKKRRQFNMNQWAENPEYRKYVVENRIINTNLIPNEPEFINNRERGTDGTMTGRRIQIYVEPVAPRPAPATVKKSDGSNGRSLNDEGEMTTSISMADFIKSGGTPVEKKSKTVKPAQQTNDTGISNTKEKVVPSTPEKPIKTKAPSTVIQFKKEPTGTKSKKKRAVRGINQLNDGEQTKPCNKLK